MTTLDSAYFRVLSGSDLQKVVRASCFDLRARLEQFLKTNQGTRTYNTEVLNARITIEALDTVISGIDDNLLPEIENG